MSNNSAERLIKAGCYRHYKGQYYQVLAQVRHSEEDEPYVLYRALYGDFGLWVRPLAMFCEFVEIQEELIARFSYVGDQPPTDVILPCQTSEKPALLQAIWQGQSDGTT